MNRSLRLLIAAVVAGGSLALVFTVSAFAGKGHNAQLLLSTSV